MEKKAKKNISFISSEEEQNEQEYASEEKSRQKQLIDMKSKQTKKIEKQIQKIEKIQSQPQPVSLEVYYLLKLQQNLVYQVTSLHTRIMKIIETQFDYSSLL